MISADSAIRVLRRDLQISALLRTVALGVIILLTFVASSTGAGWAMLLAVIGTIGIWMFLSYRSARGSYLTADSPSLIAAGQFEEAEQQLASVINTFWLFRSVKLVGVHQLAVLRHAQKQWEESAKLSRALLSQRLRNMPDIARASRLMLADASLELGDLPGTYAALSDLYSQQLSLQEAMTLLAVQLDYEARIAAWPEMFRNIAQKVQLAELMPSPMAARTQALLALACKRINRPDWTAWLQSRAELLFDINEMTAQRPILKELWESSTKSDVPTA